MTEYKLYISTEEIDEKVREMAHRISIEMGSNSVRSCLAMVPLPFIAFAGC